MGRRWGKTTLGGAIVLGVLSGHGKAAWIVPEYKNGRALWRYIQNVCANARQAKLLDISKSERVVVTPHGGFLGIYSADNIDAIRNEWFHVVVIDEAGRVTEEARADAIMPTLADAEGDEIDIGTPKGMNAFYHNWRAAGLKQNEDEAAFSAPTAHNPIPAIQRTVARVKALMEQGRYSLRSYQQEWEAKFIADGAGVFRNIRALSTLAPEPPDPEGNYLMGVDWGRSNDETVCSLWDIGRLREVYLDRYTDVPFSLQYQRIKSLAIKYNNALVIAEANAAQDAHIEALAGMDVRVMPFLTTNATKQFGVDQLAAACERAQISFQSDEQGILQMEAFESSRTPSSGLVKYAAPEGMHDDICLARIIAYSGLAQSGPVILNTQAG